MKEVSDAEDLLTRFLLGEVDERERAEVEDRLLSDAEFYEQMLAAEDDLTDAYVRGELPAGKREQFEKVFFASTRRRERVEFARGLASSATRLHETRPAKPRAAAAHAPADSARRKGFLVSLLAPRPALRYALAAAAVAVVAVAVWLALERMRAPRVEPQQARTEGVAPQGPEERTRESGQKDDGGVASRQQEEAAPPSRGTVNATPDAARPPERDAGRERRTTRARPVFATITLAPGSLRDGAEGGGLFIPRAATHLRVRLQLEADNYRSYRATLSTPEGRRIWTGDARKDRATNAHSVTLTLPAASLRRGDYVVELSGAGAGGRLVPAAAYSFRVTRED